MITKQAYIEMCKSSLHIPLFFTPEWLDIYGQDWKVISSKMDSTTLYFPFFLETKWGFKFIRNPILTPYHGFIANKALDQIEPEKLMVLAQELWHQLPKYDELYIDFHPSLMLQSNLHGIQFSNKRTNYLKLDSLDNVYNNFKSSLQRQIKKAQKNLLIEEHNDMNGMYQLYKKSLLQKGIEPIDSVDIFSKVWEFCKVNACGKIYFAKDSESNVHATLFIVYDAHTTYYLAGGTDKTFYGSGAMGYLLWHAIQFGFNTGKKIFDFEGSMDEGIQSFFSTFGTEIIPYMHTSIKHSKLLQFIKKVK
jgi:lipid II:glycine glycyltransferase (peptidoglycan interpeptide bridge formation enzyme)